MDIQINKLPLRKGEWLDNVISRVETNTILNKTITGIGATSLEINTPRNSIIIEPNVPVIVCKEQKHHLVFGVYEGITTKMVAKYLNTADGFYKILTTPESFHKVRRAIIKQGMSLYLDFFLLFDECEKVIQDVDYRQKISLPFDDFFKSKNKAMVSATPLLPSDPRFAEQGFRIDKIVPDYDYRKEIILLPTNNVQATLKLVFRKLKHDERACIFFNSTNGIEEIIRLFELQETSNVYCGTESKDKLISHKLKNVADQLTTTDGITVLNRFNFFTSRFYSAVDIDLPDKPVVILLTEVFSTPHSMIDPTTEAIQIAGRFRNGISKLIHITNYNPKLEHKTADVLSAYLEGQHKVYSEFQAMRQRMSGTGELHILKQAMECVDYSRFILPNGSKNYFMYDNAFIDEYVKSVYMQPRFIKAAYRNSKAFIVNYKYINSAISDSDRKTITDKLLSEENLNKLFFKFLKKHIRLNNDYDKEYLDSISESYKLLLEAYDLLGEKKLLEIGFRNDNLRKAVSEKKVSDRKRSIGVVTAIARAFRENSWYSTNEINRKLTQIYNMFSIETNRRGMAQEIKLYFDAEPRNRIRNRGWFLRKMFV